MPHCQRALKGGSKSVPNFGKEIQQGQETDQGFPAEVRSSAMLSHTSRAFNKKKKNTSYHL